MMTAGIHRLRTDVELPKYMSKDAVGFDLAAAEAMTIKAHEHAYVATGLVIRPPSGYSLFLFSRSSLFKKTGLMLANGVGVIDPDFCGESDELRLSVWNATDQPIAILAGQRLAQGVFLPFQQIPLEEFTPSAPNRGGLGSTH